MILFLATFVALIGYGFGVGLCALLIWLARARLPDYAAMVTFPNLGLAFVMVVIIAACSSYWLFSNSLCLDDHLERLRLRRMPEGLIGIENPVKLEAVRDEPLRIDPAALNRLEQHGSRGRINQARGDGDVPIPKPLEMQVGLGPVNPDVGNRPTRSDDVFASYE